MDPDWGSEKDDIYSLDLWGNMPKGNVLRSARKSADGGRGSLSIGGN